MKQCLLLVFLALATIVGAQTPSGLWNDNYDISWWGSSKATDKSYTISNARQLAGMAWLVNNGHTNFDNDTTLTLSNNLDLSAHFWEPIGHYSLNHWSNYDRDEAPDNKPFKGIFDGSGHIIKGLVIDKSTDNPNNNTAAGLFSCLSGAGMIKNIVLEAPQVTGSNFEYKTPQTAALVGAIYYATGSITGCGIAFGDGSGFVQGGSVLQIGSSVTGGLIGDICSYSSISVSNCYVAVPVTGGQEGKTFASCPTSSSSTGGLIGGSAYANVSNCYTAGSVTGGVSEFSSTGGLIGSGSANVSNCFVTNLVTGGEARSSHTGGLIGWGLTANNCLVISPSIIENGHYASTRRILVNDYETPTLIGNYAWESIIGEPWDDKGEDKFNGADWDGLMSSPPISNNWNPAIWDIDETNKLMPKLKNIPGQTDIPNPLAAEGGPTGIKTVETNNVSVYTTDNHIVVQQNIKEQATVKVYAITGLLIAQRLLTESTTKIPANKGIYIVVIESKENKAKAFKVVL